MDGAASAIGETNPQPCVASGSSETHTRIRTAANI